MDSPTIRFVPDQHVRWVNRGSHESAKILLPVAFVGDLLVLWGFFFSLLESVWFSAG